ncbi:aspartic peptidase domain-containing protein [Elsinoe ampelina]|uniref:Probable aspartic-type endopeptidase OPSB n=1 Tax=Elsinoe ampelina TaxID=302913 RepID=A0A6A6G6A2_9PEZI|nr:aspartic peptidase domain-containing protein [Elsinoe ampelina]
MRSFGLLALASALISSTSAVSLQERSDALPKVFHASIERRHVSNPLRRDRLRRRQSKVIEQVLDNEETLYYANASLGTPAQSVRLHLDTGSSDMWVNTPDSEICTYQGQGLCDFAGTYSPNSSSSYRYLNSAFTIQYADGSGASGDYVTDTFSIGGATLQNQQFAVGYSSNSQEGILGIGYTTNEAILSVRGGRSYPNVPQNMLDQGLINTNAYSLWLNDLDASTGEILFGGVNTEKFVGNLSTLPVIQSNGRYTAFYIALTGLGADGQAGSINSSFSTAVLLDSGSSLSYLPDNLANAVFSEFGVTYDTQQGAAFIDCSRANEGKSLLFTFSEPTISVDISELIITVGVRRNGDEICILGIAPTGGSTPVLGDTFLRSAYVVYDISGNQIALAQTNFNSTTDRILEITNATGTQSGIPDATGVANAVTSVANAPNGGGARNGLGTVSSVAAAPTKPPRAFMPGVGVAAAAAGVAMFAL